MSEITELRRKLTKAVEPILLDDELVTVSAAPSEYEAGLNKLRFHVVVTVAETGEGGAERLDELLAPGAGVKAALEGAQARVTRSSGHQLHNDGLGVTWTAECIT